MEQAMQQAQQMAQGGNMDQEILDMLGKEKIGEVLPNA
jgi:hypothetical protein